MGLYDDLMTEAPAGEGGLYDSLMEAPKPKKPAFVGPPAPEFITTPTGGRQSLQSYAAEQRYAQQSAQRAKIEEAGANLPADWRQKPQRMTLTATPEKSVGQKLAHGAGQVFASRPVQTLLSPLTIPGQTVNAQIQAALQPVVRPDSAQMSYGERFEQNYVDPQVSRAMIENADESLLSQGSAALAASLMDMADPEVFLGIPAAASAANRAARRKALGLVAQDEARAMSRAAEGQALDVARPEIQHRMERVIDERGARPLADLKQVEAGVVPEPSGSLYSHLIPSEHLPGGPNQLPTSTQAALRRLEAKEAAEQAAREEVARVRADEQGLGLYDHLMEEPKLVLPERPAPQELLIPEPRGPVRDPNAPGVGLMGPEMPPKPGRLRTQEDILAEHRPAYREAEGIAPEEALQRQMRQQAEQEAELAHRQAEQQMMSERQAELEQRARLEGQAAPSRLVLPGEGSAGPRPRLTDELNPGEVEQRLAALRGEMPEAPARPLEVVRQEPRTVRSAEQVDEYGRLRDEIPEPKPRMNEPGRAPARPRIEEVDSRLHQVEQLEQQGRTRGPEWWTSPEYQSLKAERTALVAEREQLATAARQSDPLYQELEHLRELRDQYEPGSQHYRELHQQVGEVELEILDRKRGAGSPAGMSTIVDRGRPALDEDALLRRSFGESEDSPFYGQLRQVEQEMQQVEAQRMRVERQGAGPLTREVRTANLRESDQLRARARDLQAQHDHLRRQAADEARRYREGLSATADSEMSPMGHTGRTLESGTPALGRQAPQPPGTPGTGLNPAPQPQAPPPGARAAQASPSSSTPRDPVMDVKSRPQLARELAGTLKKMDGTRWTYGKFKGSRGRGKAPGRYTPRAGVIEQVKAGDLSTGYHEAFHAVDRTGEFSSNPDIAAELDQLGAQGHSSWRPGMSIQRRRQEGIAEFGRLWFEDPQRAKALAPKAWAAMEKWTKESGDVGRRFLRHQADFQLHINAPHQARLRAQRVAPALETPITMTDVVAGTWDRFRSLELLKRDVEGAAGRALAPSEDPYHLARMLAGLDNVFASFLNGGTVRFGTREVTGKGLKEIFQDLKTVQQVEDFQDYLVARRADELHLRNIETGLDPGDVSKTLKDLDSPEFRRIAKEVYDWQDSVLDYAVDGGYLTREMADKFRELNKNYVPFHRLYEVGAGELPVQQMGGGRGLVASSPSSLKKIRGSAREIVNPVDSMIRNMAALITATERNRVGQTLADLVDRDLGNTGHWLTEVEPPMEMRNVHIKDTVSARRLRQELESIGVDFDSMGVTDRELSALMDLLPDKKLASIKSQVPLGQNQIRVKAKDGSYRFFQLEPGLYKAFNAMDEDQIHWAANLLAPAADALRQGATTLNLFFGSRNLVKDSFDAATVSRVGSKPLANSLWGMSLLLQAGLSKATKGRVGKAAEELVRDWMLQGGKQGADEFLHNSSGYRAAYQKVWAAMSPKAKALTLMPKWMEKVAPLRNAYQGAVNSTAGKVVANVAFSKPAEFIGRALKSPFDALYKLAEFSESSTRVGEYAKALKHYEKQQPGWSKADIKAKAAFESRDLLDFSQRGSQVRNLRRIVPFLGSNMTGNYRFWKALAEDPRGVAKRRVASAVVQGLSFITLPTLALYAANRDDADYWQIPQQERDTHWHIRIGPESDDFLRIPKPHIIGTLFATFPERLAQHLGENDPRALDGMMKLVEEQTLVAPEDFLTPLGKVAVELGTNHNFFTGRPVEPPWMERKNLPAYLESDEYSTVLARLAAKSPLGRAAKVSPLQLDHAMNGLTGGGGMNIVRGVVDPVLSRVTGEEKAKQRSQRWGGWHYTEKRFESENRFWDELGHLKEQAAEADALGSEFDQADRLNEMKAAEDRLKELYSARKSAEGPDEVRAINAEVRSITEEFQAPTGRYRGLSRTRL